METAAVPTVAEAAPADLMKAMPIEKEVVCAATAEVSTEKEAAPVTLMKAAPDKLHQKEVLKEMNLTHGTGKATACSKEGPVLIKKAAAPMKAEPQSSVREAVCVKEIIRKVPQE